jgi:hypothetical protein
MVPLSIRIFEAYSCCCKIREREGGFACKAKVGSKKGVVFKSREPTGRIYTALKLYTAQSGSADTGERIN